MNESYTIILWMFDSPLLNLAVSSFSLFLLWRTIVVIVGFIRGG